MRIENSEVNSMKWEVKLLKFLNQLFMYVCLVRKFFKNYYFMRNITGKNWLVSCLVHALKTSNEILVKKIENNPSKCSFHASENCHRYIRVNILELQACVLSVRWAMLATFNFTNVARHIVRLRSTSAYHIKFIVKYDWWTTTPGDYTDYRRISIFAHMR